MRPYLAIIKDSFRAAWASKVLYVLLALITLLLVVLAPLHYRQTRDWKLISANHVEHFDSIGKRLVDGINNVDDTDNVDGVHRRRLLRRIWNELPDGLRDDLNQTFAATDKTNQAENNKPTKRNLETFRELIAELNSVIQQPDFFATSDAKTLELNREIEEILDSADQSRAAINRKRRANRSIIVALFVPLIEVEDTTSLLAYYGPWPLEFLDSFAASEIQFTSGIASYIPGILDKFVLSIGLAVAIVVTASIIPETFEPGSLNLLLSKPVSRPGLFIAKFIGGCVFVSICATYLFSGVWLWLGLALGVWESAILFSILLYVVVFGIYFSVSALIGLVYRSTVLSIMVTLLFWVACFLVGTSHGFLDTHLRNKRIVNLRETDGVFLALDRMSQLSTWNEQSRQWISPYPPDDQPRDGGSFTAASWFGDLEEFPLPFGPLVNPTDQRFVAGRTSMTNMLSFGQQELLTSPPGGGPLQSRGNFPRGTLDFLQGTTALVAVTGEGKFFQFGQSAIEQPTARPAPDAEQTRAAKKTGNRPTAPANGKLFIPLGPDRPTIIPNRGGCALNSKTNEIATYGNRIISVFRWTDDGYELDRSIEVETNAPESITGLLAYQGETLLLALGNGLLISLDGDTLKERFGYRPRRNHAIEDLVASPDGRWFIAIYRDGAAWVLDQQNPATMMTASFSGQGSISAVSFPSDREVLVIDRVNELTRYQLPNFQVIQSVRPQNSTVEQIFYWLIQPLYAVWPKPGEFYKVVAFLADGGGDTDDPDNVDLTLKPRYTNPWAPLTGGLAFMVVMIGLSCVYFWRKDY